MSIFDGDEPRTANVHELGQSLDGLSVSDLEERIAALRTEIERLETDLRAKQQSRDAASAAFKPSIS